MFEKFTPERGLIFSEETVPFEKKLYEDYGPGIPHGKLWEEFPYASSVSSLKADFRPESSHPKQREDFVLESAEKRDTVELRPLNEKEKATLKSIHMTDENIKKCLVDSNGTFYLNCKNQEYAGMRHPETGVLYVEKTINIDGVRIHGVFPEFSSVFDTTLPESMRNASESVQFKYLNKQLSEAVKSNPNLRKAFTEKQLAMIQDGKKPVGFTWHHNEQSGKMQLVQSDEHAKTGHTGGNSIWSGGT